MRTKGGAKGVWKAIDNRGNNYVGNSVLNYGANCYGWWYLGYQLGIIRPL